ncbi:MAG: accessory factor UbiK family protein [Gammaproteobacteria bacterium]|jgi:ubiquinone biosynthesis accessory factor UbiK|nr:accessory factor UbiK family protein [Gammaproteobacteria bacterium]MBT6754651.1 accessory factor UbiK family protein [Gammaproteobacteria bacterium]MBT7523173.1 accessory factor UbiK family protein [Gammaproteobacteria bacterium]MBT7814439.1 accessory factor UbiK family protein [Gammaproteobacteria bacterium]MDA9896553.1 accessory factor UbiK family protein [Gammaproteobacteria bacterium]|tara:strand:+ start:198 stop:449 length:252 start_codon:yes stop_codon:yes gene_type:complete
MFKFDPKNVDDFANKIKDIMPESLKSSKEEMQKTLKSGAEGVLQKLDLVSREEYDIQVALLNKCQEKIDELEAKISELETKNS